jgi:hypothetical protein
MVKDKILREQLLALLFGRNAHVKLDDAIKDFPQNFINRKDHTIPYSPWELLEHIRIAQWDILEFMLNPEHISPEFPEGYWPDRNYQASWNDWKNSVSRIKSDLEQIRTIIQDSSINILSEIPHAPGYTYFRELLLVADHNSYHTGGMVNLRRTLGIW